LDIARSYHPGTRLPDEYYKSLIRSLAKFIRQGLSAALIAERLNNLGIYTHSGKRWTADLISALLCRFRNPKYTNQARSRAFALVFSGELTRLDVDAILTSKGLSCH
jgi:hypothetical protein